MKTMLFDPYNGMPRLPEDISADPYGLKMIIPLCSEQFAVPSGYQLSPLVPTPEMIKVGGHVNSEWLNDDAPNVQSKEKS